MQGKVVRLMDRETEREIWKRVQGTTSLNAEESLLPERLEQLVEAQKQTAAAQRQLAQRMGGGARSALRQMAAENEKDASELTALYYLMTGRRLRLKAKAEPLPRDPSEAIRALWSRERKTAQDSAELARSFSAEAADFSQLRARAERRQTRLARILGDRFRQ